MSVELHILKASGRLEKFEDQITSSFKGGLKKIEKEITLPDVDVIVVDFPDGAIDEFGTGGFSPTAHLLYINIDPDNSNFIENVESEIQSTLAHELHHCARWNTVGYGDTLLEAVVSEGLADHFDIEINGDQPKPWSIAVQGDELEKIKKKAFPIFGKKYNESEWFWGSGTYPKWTAYSLGFDIVNNYIKKSGKLASELVGEEARSFIK